jgi:hypothetical protein
VLLPKGDLLAAEAACGVLHLFGSVCAKEKERGVEIEVVLNLKDFPENCIPVVLIFV